MKFVFSPDVILCWLTGLKAPTNYLQGQGHSVGSYVQNMIVSTISSELLILCYQTWGLIVYYYKASLLRRNWIALFIVFDGQEKTGLRWD